MLTSIRRQLELLERVLRRVNYRARRSQLLSKASINGPRKNSYMMSDEALVAQTHLGSEHLCCSTPSWLPLRR